jgi:hypothetical protein
MAYLAADGWTPAFPAPSATRIDPKPLARFAQIERNVIALAAHDPVASIEPPGRLAGLLRHWLGLEPPNQLADPRLETLRRFTILLRAAPHRIRMPEVRRFLAAGFTTSQARALIGLAPKLA